MNFRIFETPDYQFPKPFNCSADVYGLCQVWMRASREIFVIFFLDAKNNIMEHEVHSIGDVDNSAVYPRQVYRSAIATNSSSLIFAHHHPAGDCNPSSCDDQITKQLVLCGELLGIKVLDHVIVGKDGYFSYGDMGLIEEYKRGGTIP